MRPEFKPRRWSQNLVGWVLCPCIVACATPSLQPKRAGPGLDPIPTSSCGAHESAGACLATHETGMGPVSARGSTSIAYTTTTREGPAPRVEAGTESWIILAVFLVSMSALTGFVLLRTLPPFCDASLGCHHSP